jgi:threonine synthase
MSQYKGYRCSLCNQEFEPADILYTCPKCGGNLDVLLDIEHIRSKYQVEDIISRSEGSLWRY